MLSAVHLQVGQLEVSLVAARVGTHEGTLLVGLAGRAHDGGSHAGHTPDILQGQRPAEATWVSSALISHTQVTPQHLPRTKRCSDGSCWKPEILLHSPSVTLARLTWFFVER